ncbi:DUF3488 and transglutaminase-like domain-containing protein [Aquihabitans sp. G128]|uniref:transglutaminase family protein n=1 Tax=Aquihabitans sp. G128 TaxID=2849779 RepID=UPI001C24242E|nr:DUF3488 and transglutaminase-like domain-containing protein [Aquihabitans sp. G128]QXC62286.1 DUF3488 and transglutaminase-like domain-containing protein [Aquihabitans sp. G128]
MTATAVRPASAAPAGRQPNGGGPKPARGAAARMPAAVSETALLLVHLSVVLGFSRLYEEGSFALPLATFVVGAHVLAVVARRRRVPAPLVAVLAVVGGALAATWILFPATARYGLPTTETWHAAQDALRLSRAQFDEVAAPAPVTPGFQLTSGLALWGAVWFSDWAAFRLRATIEAVAPPAVLFTFCAMLGSGDHRFSSAAAFTGAVLLFVASHRALRAQLDQAWLTTSPVTGPRAILRAGAALAVVGLVGGAVVGPHLPGSGSDPLVKWRADNGSRGDRTTVSPIVDLRKRLVNQTSTPLFQVRADRKAYWRLTSLDIFDGQIWRSSNPVEEADGRLDRAAPRIEQTRRNRQHVTVQDLATTWVPVAYQARELEDASDDMSWDSGSATLVIDELDDGTDVTPAGLDYTVVSETPVFEADALRASGDGQPDAISDRYLDLPAGFPGLAREAARAVTAGLEGRYDQALALQDWFRSRFTYSLDVPAGHSDSAMVDFLESRTGYCEQFAGTYAAMARSLGIPARVAVGFTPGDAVKGKADTYQVRGRHAHAWPEVYFAGLGWVPFEPTPGRGMPDTEQYTGEREQQAAPDITISTTSTTTTAPGPTASSTVPGPTAPATTVPRTAATPTTADDGSSSGPSRTVLAAVALGVLALAWLLALLLAPVVRARRRRPVDRAAAAVLDGWQAALGPVRWLTGLHPHAAETHDEFARRAGPGLGSQAGPFTALASLATRAAWDPSGSSPAAADEAASIADALRQEAVGRQSTAKRVRRRLSWREAFGRPRPAT